MNDERKGRFFFFVFIKLEKKKKKKRFVKETYSYHWNESYKKKKKDDLPWLMKRTIYAINTTQLHLDGKSSDEQKKGDSIRNQMKNYATCALKSFFFLLSTLILHRKKKRRKKSSYRPNFLDILKNTKTNH